MSLMATKFPYRLGSKISWRMSASILKMSGEPCQPPPPCPCPPPKPEPSLGEPEPPPCPKLPPPCPPKLCAQIPDPGNPCNYCPPETSDPDALNLSKLKKLQCKFQQNNGVPVFLKGGTSDVILYQATLTVTILLVIVNLFAVIKNF